MKHINGWPVPFPLDLVTTEISLAENPSETFLTACVTAAKRPDLSLATARLLMSVNNFQVNEHLAYNACTPVEALIELAQHPNANVRSSLVLNEALPLEVLRMLVSDRLPWVRYKAIRHENMTDKSIFLKALGSPDESYRRSAVMNTNMQIETLRYFIFDNSEYVSHEATKMLRYRIEGDTDVWFRDGY